MPEHTLYIPALQIKAPKEHGCSTEAATPSAVASNHKTAQAAQKSLGPLNLECSLVMLTPSSAFSERSAALESVLQLGWFSRCDH